jgi:hypothetical protein
MRAALLRARATGTNIAFLGANAMYRHIRFAASRLGQDRIDGVGTAAETFVDPTTENLLRVFAAGPAGRIHPAIDNLARVKPAPGARFGGPE